MWNQRYAEDGFAYGTDPNDFLAQCAPRIPAGRVLCLAEGEGRNAVFLAQQGHAVTAVDMSEVGLEKARQLAQACGVSLTTIVADLADFEIEEGQWSCIVSIWCHVPPPIRKELHRKVVAGLAPGGVLVLEAYTPGQVARGTGGPPVAGPMMTAAALREELDGLTFAVLHEVTREIHEGKYHNGTSEVVQVLAFRPPSP